MTDSRPAVAIIGMGGFAREHHRAIYALEQAGECRLICACDPAPDAFAADRKALRFDERGIVVYADWREMLARHRAELNLVTVPTPIFLHEPMHRACVDYGLPCYLEKPPTLDCAELETMIETDRRAAVPAQVGFNFIIEPLRQAWKTRLMAGEFGPLQRITFLGFWPRDSAYYARAAWAGRLLYDGSPLLDSCIGNALAHYIHNLLFWAGQRELLDWEPVAEMKAEMARAHRIEGMDTVFAQAQCHSGVEVRAAVSHACAGAHQNVETIFCERAALTYITGQDCRIDWKDGRRETASNRGEELLAANFRHYLACVRGEHPRPLTRLVDSRPFVWFNDLAYLAAGQIADVPAEFVQRGVTADGQSGIAAIADLAAISATFLETGRLPSEQGVSWAIPGQPAFPADLPRLPDMIAKMALK